MKIGNGCVLHFYFYFYYCIIMGFFWFVFYFQLQATYLLKVSTFHFLI